MGERKTSTGTTPKGTARAAFADRIENASRTSSLVYLLRNSSLDDVGDHDAPHFLRTSAEVLSSIRNLPHTADLVLFTPVVPPPPRAASEENRRKIDDERASYPPMDPFEPLGRALHKHHRRIQHVPYIPSVGMTATHATFLQCSSAVVIVVCESGGGGGGGGGSGSGSGNRSRSSPFGKHRFENQAEFAHDIMAHKLAQDGPKPALLVLITGGERSKGRAAAAAAFGSEFEVLVHSRSYEPGALGKVADLVFGT